MLQFHTVSRWIRGGKFSALTGPNFDFLAVNLYLSTIQVYQTQARPQRLGFSFSPPLPCTVAPLQLISPHPSISPLRRSTLLTHLPPN